jgi:hypothetical protein
MREETIKREGRGTAIEVDLATGEEREVGYTVRLDEDGGAPDGLALG